MSDPAIEPESGELWSVLYARLWVVYLETLAQLKR